MLFRIEKKKIFLLYQYFSFSVSEKEKNINFFLKNIPNPEEKNWIKLFLKKREDLQKKITKNLNQRWEFFRLKPLEKAILMYSVEQIINNQKKTYIIKLLFDQIINFSKSYLEKNQHKYINKVLDSFWKEETEKLK